MAEQKPTEQDEDIEKILDGLAVVHDAFEKMILTRFSPREHEIARNALQCLTTLMWSFAEIRDLHQLSGLFVGTSHKFEQDLEKHFRHGMPYADYLLTEHWQKMRSEALERALHRCQVCYSTTTLNVHHRTYERRGNEIPEDLIVLCQSCHQLFHDNGKLQVGE